MKGRFAALLGSRGFPSPQRALPRGAGSRLVHFPVAVAWAAVIVAVPSASGVRS